MTLLELVILLDAELQIRISAQSVFFVEIAWTKIRVDEEHVSLSVFSGKKIEEALNNYVKGISGKTLVCSNWKDGDRKTVEFTVPDDLEVGEII